MFWKEDDDADLIDQVPDTIQDLLFSIDCKTLPLDHGYALSQQILTHLPWIGDEPGAAIHQIHVAESANGWMRPDDPEHEVLHVSHRTKMTLRMPRDRFEDVQQLVGKTLDIDGHQLIVGKFRPRKLSKLTTIFARYLDTEGVEDESRFLNACAQQLLALDIRVKKMMSGRLLEHQTPIGPLLTRKLMISGLDVAESIRLQEQGLGSRQLLGMGIFLPHKGIDAVNKKQE
jgi:CRISPR-associated protein Cas6